MKRSDVVFGLALAGLAIAGVAPAAAQVQVSGSVVIYTVPPPYPYQFGTAHRSGARQTASGQVDFINAAARPLPVNRAVQDPRQALMRAVQSPRAPSRAGVVRGEEGSGDTDPVDLGKPSRPSAAAAGGGTRLPQAVGLLDHPFSTAKADLDLKGATPTNKRYPYRASGRLFFTIGNDTYVCSASLIKPGVAVTAAHCVASFGAQTIYSSHRFVPGYRNGEAPYGVWSAAQIILPLSYYLGSAGECDPAAIGVVCKSDLALIVLDTKSGQYPGHMTGWYSYGWDAYGFSGTGMTQVTQIGYPVCLDDGAYMQRNDSYGVESWFESEPVRQTVIGSRMCGGSSGGPWLVNFGIPPAVSEASPGESSDPNVVIGVTSWGYTEDALKEQGASRFTSADGNIVSLMAAACPAGSRAGHCLPARRSR